MDDQASQGPGDLHKLFYRTLYFERAGVIMRTRKAVFSVQKWLYLSCLIIFLGNHEEDDLYLFLS